MVRCSDGTLYPGAAEDARDAVAALNAGGGSDALRERLPVFMAYTEEYMNARDADRRAASLRAMPAEHLERLVAVASAGAVEDLLSGAAGAA